MRLPLQVHVFLIAPPTMEHILPRLLLLRRVPERGGIWQGVTGGVESGESWEAAAERELQEETGFVGRIEHPAVNRYTFALMPQYAHYYPGATHVTETVFPVISGAFEPVLSAEHDRYQWCEFSMVTRQLHWPENVRSFQLLQRWSHTCYPEWF